MLKWFQVNWKTSENETHEQNWAKNLEENDGKLIHYTSTNKFIKKDLHKSVHSLKIFSLKNSTEQNSFWVKTMNINIFKTTNVSNASVSKTKEETFKIWNNQRKQQLIYIWYMMN